MHRENSFEHSGSLADGRPLSQTERRNALDTPLTIPCSRSDSLAPERSYIGQGDMEGPGPAFRQANSARSAFRQHVKNVIQETPSHPLSFLLDDKGDFHKARPGPLLDEDGHNSLSVFQAGHGTSARHFRDRGEDQVDSLGVQSRYHNQSDARSVESKGAGFSVTNTFYDVGGIPVEYRTLRDYRDWGRISADEFEKAVSNGEISGWSR